MDQPQRIPRRRCRSASAGAIVAAACFFLVAVHTVVGCAGSDAADRAETVSASSDRFSPGPTGDSVEPLEPRVDAVAGKTLLIPVRVIGDPSTVTVTLDDGTAPRSAVRWIAVESDESWNLGPRTRFDAWLPPAGIWRTSDRPTEGRGAELCVLAVDLPESSIGRSLLIGRRRVELNWLSSPMLLAGDDRVVFDPPIPAALRSARSLAEFTRAERQSPVRRWRYRLLMTGLDPAVVPAAPTSSPGEPTTFADPLLEALAQQAEARWTAALGNLSTHDPALTRELAARICAVADLGGGVVAPLWPLSQSDLDTLLSELLDPSRDAQARANAARRWIDQQPPAHAWIIDDAGEQDGTTARPVTRVGLANLRHRPAVAWTTWLDTRGQEVGARPDLSPIGPHATLELLTPLPAEAAPRGLLAASASSRDDPRATLVAHVGPWQRALLPAVGSRPAFVPSMTIGPFSVDQTLAEFLDDRESPPEARWSTAAVLYREASDTRSTPGAAPWTLMIQCRRPSPEDVDPAAATSVALAEDQVRVWIGSRSKPAAAVTISESGGAAPIEPDGESLAVRVVRERDRWIAIVTIPRSLLERSGFLRMGLDRVDSRGVRSAWPRAMLPWLDQPARAVIDTAAWDRINPAR